MTHRFFVKFITLTAPACLFLAISCNKNLSSADTNTDVSFEAVPLSYPLANLINEASGIADSKINPGYLWVQEDSGTPPQLYLLNHSGATEKKVYLKGAINIDWEDLCLAAGPDPSKRYLYIGETGDNDAVHPTSAFYRFEEPPAATDTVRAFDLIVFRYADGPRDAEAFLVDDNTKDIYIISKRDATSGIYKLTYPYSTTALNTAVYAGALPYNGVVSAARSADGSGILIKTYTTIYYYPVMAGESIVQVLQKPFTTLGYQLEPQGEAVCFAQDNSGFYTLSEKGFSGTQSLYFYKRK